MSEGKRRWARILSGSSVILLLMAVISLWQVYDDFTETYDPESNFLVKLEPGESGSFDIRSSNVISALRISDGETPDANLLMTDSVGEEVSGREPGILDPNRIGADQSTVYSPVRVFEGVAGTYTLENQGSSTLWLVDDEEAANRLAENPLIYMFYIGCCIGSPMGIVGIVLAMMAWTDRKKSPDQFFVTEDGRVIITQSGEIVQVHTEIPEVEQNSDSDVVKISQIDQPKENRSEEDSSAWQGWDDG